MGDLVFLVNGHHRVHGSKECQKVRGMSLDQFARSPYYLPQQMKRGKKILSYLSIQMISLKGSMTLFIKNPRLFNGRWNIFQAVQVSKTFSSTLVNYSDAFQSWLRYHSSSDCPTSKVRQISKQTRNDSVSSFECINLIIKMMLLYFRNIFMRCHPVLWLQLKKRTF